MHVACETLDDVLRELYPELLRSANFVSTSRGDTSELVGVLVEIKRPRARLSRTETRGKPFSCLGELLWYLSGENRLDFIRAYIPKYADESEDGVTIHGAYGPRLFNQRGHNQVNNVLDLLRSNPGSRRAVIQLFNAEDISCYHREVPCTTTLQLVLREGCLHMVTTMRSNDAYMGLPHDVFCFTMLQEIMARSLGLDLGTYRHFVGSMHLYSAHREQVQQYLEEGVQPTNEMSPMPEGDPWPSIRILLEAEHRIRTGAGVDADTFRVDPYWADLIRLLQIFTARGDKNRVDALKAAMASRRYGPYIDSRKNVGARALDAGLAATLALSTERG
jgi:thymidylate synthase